MNDNATAPWNLIDVTVTSQLVHPHRMETVTYVYVATLAAYLWDWMLSIPEECSVARRGRFSLPIITYFLSRASTLANCIGSFIIAALPIVNCQALSYTITGLWEVAMPATSFLFLLRVRAVFHDSKPIQIFFGFFWAAVLCTSIFLMLSIESVHVPESQLCVQVTTHTFGSLAGIVPAAFDTCVFLAISWRMSLCTAFVGSTLAARIRCFFGGKGLAALPKALLHGGQAYYGVTIGFAIMSSILFHTGPDTFRSLLGPPYLALSNVMACHVFRVVMLSRKRGPKMDSTEMTSVFQGTGDSDVATIKGYDTIHLEYLDMHSLNRQFSDPSSVSYMGFSPGGLCQTV